MPAPIRSHRDLDVYGRAFDSASRIFELSKTFPREETYSLTDQIRRSSRSVTANIAEAWRKRRYEGAFISKCSDAEAEAAETQTWIEHAVKCGYVKAADARPLYREYDRIIATLVGMITHTDSWVLGKTPKS
jgi:four helix bundle protein